MKRKIQTKSLFTAITAVFLTIISLTGYSQVVYTFTNAGVVGNEGPTQADLNNEYSGTNLAGQVTSNNGIQEWSVPATGIYRITAYGAQGSNPTSSTGGLGAKVEGEFVLQQGENLRILVGQTAPNTPGREDLSSSGGGGSFVTLSPHNTNASILVIAGGGGGTGAEQPATSHGTIDETGQTGSAGAGGTNGDAGTSGTATAGAGAGFFTDGSGTAGGIAYVNGGEGGNVNTSYSVNGGGFGGGGSITAGANSRYGGGGGYSGGSGSSSLSGATTGLWGGGGGSYNNGMNPGGQSGVNEGDGYVTFEYFGNDAGVTEITTPSIPNCISEELYVNIETVGADPLTNVEIHWSVDGVTQQPRMWSGMVPSGGTSSQPVYVGSYPFEKGHEIKAWTVSPNGQPDDFYGNDTSTFEIPAFTEANLPDEVLLCEGGSERLETGLSFKKHTWSTGEDMDTYIDVTEGGLYSVTVLDDGSSGTGCEQTYEVSVIEDEPVNLPEDVVACEIDGPVTLQANVPRKRYFWSTGEQTPSISVSTSFTYWVEATDPTGKCVSTDTVDVEIDDIPDPDFTARPSLSSLIFLNLTPNADEYFWDFGDGNTSTEESPTHLYQNEGEYEVKLTATNQCGSSSTTSTFIVNPSSVEDVQNVEGISIYPNPNSGRFNISFENHNMKDTRVEVLDIQGRVIHSERVGDVSGSMKHEVNMNNVAPGVYLIKTISQDDIVSLQRISIH